VVVETGAPNAKVGVLTELARHARYPLLLVNDSDIVAPPGYLRAVTAPLADPKVGLVTCLYRGVAESWAARSEALGIATEFAPSVLVARLLGQAEFALGSTMVFRAETLRRVGGFEAIADYLADDYQLGRLISELGYRIEFAPVVVETDLGGESWAGTWRHQVRWARTIRVSRPGGYFGYVVTHATWWALVALAAGQWQAAALALGLRMVAGVAVGAGVLKDRRVARDFWLMPVRDLFGFAVWMAGLFGRTVQWRDRVLRLHPDGRIHVEERKPEPICHH
jgi:ceramide glucosyltransferase